MDGPSARQLPPPRPPEVESPRRFPLVATAAPLVLSVVLFAVTRSAFTLVFAALGPVVAVASVVDARMSRARSRRSEDARFRADLDATVEAVVAAHDEERRERGAVLPSSVALVASPTDVSARWSRPAPETLQLRIGAGEAASTLSIGGGLGAALHPAIDDLRFRASRLADAPLGLRIPSGGAVSIAVAGPQPLRESVVRGLAVQLAASLTPDDWAVWVGDGRAVDGRPVDGRPGDERAWVDLLPHPRIEPPPTGPEAVDGLGFVGDARSITIAAAGSSVSAGVEVRLEVRQDGTAVVDGAHAVLDLVGLESTLGLAAHLSRLAAQLGVGSASSPGLSELVDFGSLPVGSDDRTLLATVGQASSGPLQLDLVRQGPHAVIGGTTGSGKSELLLSWVLGMAAGRSPQVVTFLFVDFKGGASFGDLAHLPHSVGVLTDLDGAQSQRALVSLAAELRHRERELAALSLRSLDDAPQPPFPRLVVVVDEYAALVDAFPELHAAFADVAARGRSLGVHLVLCTQRPAGVVRDGILANCALRLSLRVTSAADSVALLGTDAAASLPARPLGRALVSVGGEPVIRFQVARSSGADVAGVQARWATAPSPRAPWLPPLPPHLEASALGVCPVGDDLPFALADLPHEQAQRVARYSPHVHGSLLVLGASGSGRSGVLAALAAAPSTMRATRVPRGFAATWDVVTAALAPSGAAQGLLLFDDLDVLLSACPEGYLDGFLDLLARLLREGPAIGTWCVLVAARAGGQLSGLAALCGSRLVLRMPDRTEHSFAGADAAYDPKLPPGGGFWHGDRVQVVLAGSAPGDDSGLPSEPGPRMEPVDVSRGDFAVVSSHPDALTARLRELAPGRRVVPLAPPAFGAPRDELEVSRGGTPAIVVADADTWQAQWSLFSALQRSTVILFDGCSLAEVRALTRSRDLPPPFARGERPLWMRHPDGSVSRATLVAGEALPS